MGDISVPQTQSVYKQNIQLDAQGGTEILNRACVAWNISVNVETANTVIVQISDSLNAYNPSAQVEEFVVDGPQTVAIAYPKGKRFYNGVYAVASVDELADVSMTYD